MNIVFKVDGLMVDRIVFIGPPEAGKTSIRKFFFDGIPAGELLNKPEPPSIGMKYSNYTYLFTHPIEKDGEEPEKFPFKLSLLDTSGQEIVKWLTEEKENVFNDSTHIFFICDAADWLNEDWKNTLLELVGKINKERINLAPNALLHVIVHKFDKVSDQFDKIKEFKDKIKLELQDYFFKEHKLLLDFNVIVTSLYENYRKESFLDLLNVVTNSFMNVG